MSASSTDCRTLVSVSSICGPIAAVVEAVPMVSAAMPISPQILREPVHGVLARRTRRARTRRGTIDGTAP